MAGGHVGHPCLQALQLSPPKGPCLLPRSACCCLRAVPVAANAQCLLLLTSSVC